MCPPWTLDPDVPTLDPGPWTLMYPPWTLDPDVHTYAAQVAARNLRCVKHKCAQARIAYVLPPELSGPPLPTVMLPVGVPVPPAYRAHTSSPKRKVVLSKVAQAIGIKVGGRCGMWGTPGLHHLLSGAGHVDCGIARELRGRGIWGTLGLSHVGVKGLWAAL